jgi:hypothetical protein
MARRQRQDLIAPTRKKGIGGDDERARPLLDRTYEG